MSEGSELLVFLDANVLAKPVTRTLLIYASNRSDYRIIWSKYVEDEADRHLRSRQVATRLVREVARLDLGPAGHDGASFTTTRSSDRQVLADAFAAGAFFIVTEDVDDFGLDDLTMAGISAVNPDLFLSVCATGDGYTEAVTLMSRGMTRPPRTPDELHARLGREHPRTVSAHKDGFAVDPLPATQGPPAVLYRGDRCLRCLRRGGTMATGICEDCRILEQWLSDTPTLTS